MIIGIIDSGVGGLEFLKGINLKKNKYILIMDKAFFPYGTKSKEFLIKRTLYLSRLLFLRGCDFIILACNTLSIMALDFVKEVYPNISGVIELLGNNYNNGLFIASRNTIKYVDKKIKGITVFDGQYFINKIENKTINENDINILIELSLNYEVIILGCTHFIKIKKYLKNIKYISQDEEYLKLREKENCEN